MNKDIQLPIFIFSLIKVLLKEIKWNPESGSIDLTITLTIPPTLDSEKVLFGYTRNYLKTIIENETKNKIQIFSGYVGTTITACIHFDPNNSEPNKKLELFCKTINSLMKIKLLDDCKALSLAENFTKHLIPDALRHEVAIAAQNNQLLIYTSPKPLLKLSSKKVSDFFNSKQIPHARLATLPGEISEKLMLSAEGLTAG